jgi:uncharacterized protein (TIGR03437 family)
MVDANGARLTEPQYPQNVQMNQTLECPVVNGKTFNTYKTDFVARTILPSGLWDGIHFDQPEWYPNPLLQKADGTFPPIDLSRSGTADSLAQLYQAWSDGFFSFFQPAADRLGPGQIVFGNAGYIASNRSVLAMLNGWLREIVSPYQILPNGNWVTDDAGGWFRLADRYFTALESARAPQFVFMEFMGQRLGTLSGGTTANGYPARVPSLELRDFQRMRLGLTTVLLGDGFFGYDLVDNTSDPQWFDEYAVDANGVATRDLSGKGYLGAPLGPAAELPYDGKTILSLDFEARSVPSQVTLGSGARFSNDPSEVIDGNTSLVVTRDSTHPDPIFLSTSPTSLPLTQGKVYQLIADYKVLDYEPTTFKGLAGMGVSSAKDGLTTFRTASLYLPDMEGAGQQGVFRTSVRASTTDFVVLGALTDTGTVAIDNVRLIEGSGGLWRRDFENGIVLVNPTPQAITSTNVDLSGPLNRTGIRRIQGSQAPDWNSGATASGSITLPPGDGIILLADHLAPALLSMPQGLQADAQAAEFLVTWQQNPEYVAGYHILYGEDANALDHEAAVGRTDHASLSPVDGGSTVYFSIAAYDFYGNIGPYSAPVAVTLAGDAPLRPVLDTASVTAVLAPGAVSVIGGSNLATDVVNAGSAPYPAALGSTSVLVNGIAAPLLSVSPGKIAFISPWSLAGNRAKLRVVRGGVSSLTQTVAAARATPSILSSSADPQQALAVHSDGVSAVSDTQPAARQEQITLFARNLGLVEPPPADGVLPTRMASVAGHVSVSVGGVLANVISALLTSDQVGVYRISFAIPSVPGGPQPVQITAGDQPSTSLTLSIAP